MKDRLQQFLNAENISQSSFADTIHVTRANISHILTGRNKPSYDFITNIMKYYPDLSLEWLIQGVGKMYKSATSTSSSVSHTTPIAPSNTNSLFGPNDVENLVNTSETQNIIDVSNENFETDDFISNTNVNSSNKEDDNCIIDQSPLSSTKRNVVKIIIFYDDNSFQEFNG